MSFRRGAQHYIRKNLLQSDPCPRAKGDVGSRAPGMRLSSRSSREGHDQWVSISRRDLLTAAGAAGLGAGLLGCDDQGGSTSKGAPESSPSARPSPSGSSALRPDALPATRLWQPAPQDVAPEVKQAAVQLLEIAGSWAPGEGGVQSAKRRLGVAGYDPTLVDDLGPLISRDDAAAVQVVVAQYGGILSASASVLIVIDQWVLEKGRGVRRRGTTVDVRLVADEPQWAVTTVRAARPGRRAPELTRVAQRLLENERVVLPNAAVHDVRSGIIGDSVLRALSSLSAQHRLDVSILRSGHPVRVFGTDRTSDHTDGRAVDIWALDGQPIIKRRRSAMVSDFMQTARSAGAYQVGGPVDLDGSGASYFADDTHQDHIHLGFSG